MTSEDSFYQEWITSLIAGRESAGDQAARAKFRSMQGARTPAQDAEVVSIDRTGQNVWAVRVQGDGLARYTLLRGSGIPGIVAGEDI